MLPGQSLRIAAAARTAGRATLRSLGSSRLVGAAPSTPAAMLMLARSRQSSSQQQRSLSQWHIGPLRARLSPFSMAGGKTRSEGGVEGSTSTSNASPATASLSSTRGPGIIMPLIVTLFGTLAVHAIGAIYSEYWTELLQRANGLPSVRKLEDASSSSTSSTSIFGDFTSFFSPSAYSDAPTSMRAKLKLQAQLQSAHSHYLATSLGSGLRTVLDALSFLPREAQVQVGRAYTYLAHAYLDLDPAQRAVIPIMAINTLVFLGFRLPSPRLQAFMLRHFAHVPRSRRYHTMVTSIFAHAGFFHFAANNYVLWSFSRNFISDPVFQNGLGDFKFGYTLEQARPLLSSTVGGYLGRGDAFRSDASGPSSWTPEASPVPHFLAFWVSAGLYASLGSQVWAYGRFQVARIGLQRFISKQQAQSTVLSARAAAEIVRRADALRKIGSIPGLGASGALLGTIGAVATCHPEESIGIILLPGAAVPSQTAVSGLMTFDGAALLLSQLNSPLGAVVRGWSLGHAAHLAGTLYGISYASRAADPAKPQANLSTAAAQSGRSQDRMSTGMQLWEHARLQTAKERRNEKSA
ncbi:hypothetical protein OC835_000887 [Tilletia horrida]|nr:hypothetical protein OC835_000887 [Tilletia horrida]